jgi:uncharacterized protein (UPF0264 family)
VRLLVSVTGAAEARAASEAGADVVDVKNPAEGSLGAPAPATIEAAREAVGGRAPISAAIGDMPDLPGTAALAALGAARSGADYVKVGLRESPAPGQAVALLRAVREAVAGCRGVRVVAAAYADAERLPGAPLAPALLPRVAAEAGADVCLLDTGIKDGRGLFEWIGDVELGELVAEAHAAGLEAALAGALRESEMAAVRASGADIVGVRGAACRDGRTGTLDPRLVRSLRRACLPGAEAA